mgnify:CR=1 FL=1
MGKEREMDTNVLKTFIAVCEYSGYSAAAKELGYTQSTVSSQIKPLQKQLDVRLLTVISIISIIRKSEF